MGGQTDLLRASELERLRQAPADLKLEPRAAPGRRAAARPRPNPARRSAASASRSHARAHRSPVRPAPPVGGRGRIAASARLHASRTRAPSCRCPTPRRTRFPRERRNDVARPATSKPPNAATTSATECLTRSRSVTGGVRYCSLTTWLLGRRTDTSVTLCNHKCLASYPCLEWGAAGLPCITRWQ